MPIVLLSTLFSSVARGLAEQFISSETARSWVNFGLDILDEGTEVEARLREAIDMFEQRQTEARQNGEVWEVTAEEFAAVRQRITGRDEAWAQV